MLYLKNCHIIDEVSDYIDDILIDSGKIKLIGKAKITNYLTEKNQEAQLPDLHVQTKLDILELDLCNRLVMPAFVDLHFHMRNPGQEHKETLISANKAAIKGGYTDLLAMANTNPVIDNKTLITEIIEKNNSLGMTRLLQVSAVTKELNGKDLVDFEENRKATRFFSDDGKNIDDEQIMREALLASKQHDFIILDHSEEETEMVIRNLDLVRQTGGNLHFCHISKKASMEAIIEAKKEGLKVTVEVAPHHIYASNVSYRVNPPFASEEDRLFLIESIKNGYVDAIATDHAPHTPEDKANNAPGISGIETSFSLCHKVFTDNEISLKLLSKLLSASPAKFLGLSPRVIRAGMQANLVVIEEKKSQIDSSLFESKGKNTPFDKETVYAVIDKTIRKGDILYDNGQN